MHDVPAAEARRFDSHGYALIPGLFASNGLTQLQTWTDEVQAWPDTAGMWMKYYEDHMTQANQRILTRLENFEPYHEGFSKLFHVGVLGTIATRLLGEPAILFKDKINFKLPGADGFRAHQDMQAGWQRYASIYVTAMVAIDPCTMANGCLEMAHYEHRRVALGQDWEPLPEDSLPYHPLEMQPGDAVFFDSYVPHRSGPNRTQNARRVLYVTYNAAREGDHRRQYYTDKRASYPPDIERKAGQSYRFRV